MSEAKFGVWLGDRRVGSLNQRGDYTWFAFLPEYLYDASRPVLGLAFEENLAAVRASALRLPVWFSNLLPEGRLRDWIAADRGVSIDREMELLAQVGHDLPGAVRVTAEADGPEDQDFELSDQEVYDEDAAVWRFSLAGVALKFSMLRESDRLTLPAHGRGGDWIVKLPDPEFSDVPINEYAMMDLAALVGLDVPNHIQAHRDELSSLPDYVWHGSEVMAYAVERFDRGVNRRPIHIEDFAQVRSFYPEWKYRGAFESIAALCYRGRDLRALNEYVRRIVFNILIANGDAHLKNWSLRYADARIPTLSPVYDLVSTAYYAEGMRLQDDLGLRLMGSRRFEAQRVVGFRKLGERLGVDGHQLEHVARETIDSVVDHWPAVRPTLSVNPRLQASIDGSIQARRQTLLMAGH